MGDENDEGLHRRLPVDRTIPLPSPFSIRCFIVVGRTDSGLVDDCMMFLDPGDYGSPFLLFDWLIQISGGKLSRYGGKEYRPLITYRRSDDPDFYTLFDDQKALLIDDLDEVYLQRVPADGEVLGPFALPPVSWTGIIERPLEIDHGLPTPPNCIKCFYQGRIRNSPMVDSKMIFINQELYSSCLLLEIRLLSLAGGHISHNGAFGGTTPRILYSRKDYPRGLFNYCAESWNSFVKNVQVIYLDILIDGLRVPFALPSLFLEPGALPPLFPPIVSAISDDFDVLRLIGLPPIILHYLDGDEDDSDDGGGDEAVTDESSDDDNYYCYADPEDLNVLRLIGIPPIILEYLDGDEADSDDETGDEAVARESGDDDDDDHYYCYEDDFD